MSISEALRQQLTTHAIYNHKQIFTLRGISRYGKITGTGFHLFIEFEAMTCMTRDGQTIELPAIKVAI